MRIIIIGAGIGGLVAALTLGRSGFEVHRCVALTQHRDRVEVEFHNGATADADVVVGADGIHFTVREAILGPESARFSDTWLIAGWFRRLASRISGSRSLLLHGGGRTTTSFIILSAPVRAISTGSRPLQGEWRIESWTARGDVADALKEFEGWHSQVSAIIESADATNRWALYDCDSLSRWTVGRVTLMGDAAHAMLPYMAQGAVQSIEDAAVLAKCLERGDAHDIGAALRRYVQMRMPRTSRCQEGSRRNGVMYHLVDGDDQRNRDANLASSTTAPLPQNAWLYGHAVEAEFEGG